MATPPNITLAFEPRDIKRLSDTEINTVLVNDSNYFLQFNLLRRDETEGWVSVWSARWLPNELIDLATFSQETISRMERVVLQAIAYKERGKPFEVKTPLNVSRKIDLTKFFKAHCFRPGVYFETPVIEIPLYSEPVSKKYRNDEGEMVDRPSCRRRRRRRDCDGTRLHG